MLLQALYAHSLLHIRELKTADGDGVHMLTGCGGVSQSFLTHNKEEMVEGQWKQRQKTLTHVWIRSTCSTCPAGCRLHAPVLWDKVGWGVLVLIDTVQQLVQFGPLIACSSGAVEAVYVCMQPN